MTTKEQDETPDKNVDAASTQADAKTNQDLENKKIETKELDDAQLDDTAAASYNPEAMRWYLKQKTTK